MTRPFQSNYLELLKKSLIDYGNINSYEYYPLTIINPNWKTFILHIADRILVHWNFRICKIKFVNEFNRMNGYDWPAQAKTMIGLGRLNNIESCIHNIINDKIKGDFIETGVWRGGATILMKAILKEFCIHDRKVWLADSFEGLPRADVKNYKHDFGNKLYQKKILKISEEEVKNNFIKYDLLDNNVIFLKGWFRNTLPDASIKEISLLRLDGDIYESTFLALKYLYPKLSKGGYIIIDDYNAFNNCKLAVNEFRIENNITEDIVEIDNEAIFWRKAK